MKKYFIFPLVLALLFSFTSTKPLKILKKRRTNVPEPSDIAFSYDGNSMFSVSDKGLLYQTDTLGKIIKKSDEEGLDFEGVWADEKYVYVADERARRLLVLDYDLKLVRQNEIAYSGGINLGYEGVTFNAKKGCFILVTEKRPIWFFELNNDLVKINEVKLSKIASDISGVCYHNDFVYALSDEDQMVLKLDPMTYKVLDKWKIPVTNPEGIAFDKNDNLIIASDYDQALYTFTLPESTQQ